MWIDLIQSSWASIGPLVGVILGAMLTRAWQQRQWKLQNKKEEYKTTLAVLARAGIMMLDISSTNVIRGEDEKRLYDLRIEGIIAIQQNIFIRKRLGEAKVLEAWTEMTKSLSSPVELCKSLVMNLNQLLQTIVNASDRDMESFWKRVNIRDVRK